jgi:hypothetical protein
VRCGEESERPYPLVANSIVHSILPHGLVRDMYVIFQVSIQPHPEPFHSILQPNIGSLSDPRSLGTG